MAHWFSAHSAEIFRSLTEDHRWDLQHFEGNAQGLRILTQTQNHLFRGGLRLTYATLGAFLKYPATSASRNLKFGAFLSEKHVLEQIVETLGLSARAEQLWARHPLAYLTEEADDICYAILDLEDAVELQILRFDDLFELCLDLFDESKQQTIRSDFASPGAYRVNLCRLRGHVFDVLVPAAIEGFMAGYTDIMDGTAGVKTLFDFLPEGDPRRCFMERAKKLAREQVFTDQKKVELELGAFATMECLLDAFCSSGLHKAQQLASPDEVQIDARSERILKLLGDHCPSTENAPPGSTWTDYHCLRRAIDFVSGMTDNYATYIAKQLQGMGYSGLQRP